MTQKLIAVIKHEDKQEMLHEMLRISKSNLNLSLRSQLYSNSFRTLLILSCFSLN